MQPASEYALLYKKLNYVFQDEDNLRLALTHRSAAKQHNERLEFLGDAVLGMIIAKALYHKFPKQPEGKLTRMRSSLVKGDTLAQIGQEFELGDLILLGSGERKSGGNRRDSIIADAVEAIIGAVFLEAGIEVCEAMVLGWFEQRIIDLDPEINLKDAKTRLQEYLQSRKLPLPEYEVTQTLGKDHNQTFVVSCAVAIIDEVIEGRGTSRRKAEQDAARQALEQISRD